MNRNTLSALVLPLLLAAFASSAHALTWPSRVTDLERRFESTDAAARQQVVDEMSEIDAVDVMPLLMRALSDTNAEVRAAAASASGEMGAIEALPALRLLLGDRNAAVREASATALGQLRAPGSLDALGRSLSDRENAVRIAAATAIAQLGLPEGAAVLSEALRDRNSEVAIAAAEGLAILAQPGSVYALIETMSASAEAVSIAAIDAVASLRAEQAVPALANLARGDARPPVRLAAIRALGEIASPEAVSYLLTLVEFAQGSDQFPACVEALGSLGENTPWADIVSFAVRDPYSWGPAFDNASAAAYPAFAEAWNSLPDRNSVDAQVFLSLWLTSGDPNAIELWMDFHPSIGTDDFIVGLRENGSSEAFCRAADRLGTAADYRATLFAWATEVTDSSCGRDYITVLHERGEAAALLDWDGEAENWQMPLSAPLLLVVEDALQSTSLRWEEGHRIVSWLASDSSVAGALPPLLAFTQSEDVRLQREAAYALGGLGNDAWSDSAIRSIAERSADAPWLLKALVGVRAERVQELVWPALGPWDEVDDEVLVEVLSLASRTGAELNDSLPGRACRSERFWLRRAGWQYRLRMGEMDADEIPRNVDPWLDGLVMAVAPSEDPLSVAVDRALSADVRVAAIRALESEPDSASRDLLLADRHAAVVAATWLQLAELDLLPARESLVFRAASAPSAVERAVLYSLIVADEEASQLPAFARVLAAETDSWALRVATSEPPSEPVQLFVVDSDVGVPVADVPVMVLYQDGSWELGRTDAEGRWTSPQPVLYAGAVMP